MTVFKTYFKILKRFLPMVLIYTGIFLLFAIMQNSSSNSTMSFTASKPLIAVVNYDSNTKIIESFNKYLSENCTIVNIENNEIALKDALFFREVDYIIEIPENFSRDFTLGKEIKIGTMKVPDGTASFYVEMLINRYLETASLYLKAGVSEEVLAEKILLDLNEETEIIINNEQNSTNIEEVNYYYNFTNYTFLAINILIVGMIMSSFNEIDLRKRNIISPISLKRYNAELVLANISVTILIWLLYVITSIVLYGKTMFTTNGLLLILNSLVFMISTLSISFLIASLVKNRAATSAITNILALGTSFICGAFVPQTYLGDAVLNIGKIFPSYWFIKNNNVISGMTVFNWDNLKVIFTNMSVILLFAIVYYVITNFVSAYKRKK